MRSTKKQEKLLKLGRKRQGFGAIFAERSIPAVAVGAVLCIIVGIILKELLLSIYPENDLMHFHMLINSASQNMNTMTYRTDIQSDSYKNMLAFEFYITSGEGTSSCVYKLYQKDKEVVRTVRNGVALVHGKDVDALCYADLSCYTEAYDRLSKYDSKAGLFSADTYLLAADTIYADTDKGIFVPGKMHIEHYSYDRFGQPPKLETVEEFDLSPADTTGLTAYRYGQFTGGTVFGVEADDEMFSILDRQDSNESKSGLISAATNNSIIWNDKGLEGLCWLKSDLYTPDGVQYTVTALYKTDGSPIFKNIMIFICGITLLICLAASLLRAFKTYTVYKAHYAMEDYRRDMTNTLAHDLKTPLMAISGCAEMLGEGTSADKQKHYSDMIMTNVKYMDSMITNVLELSKIESGTELKKETFDIKKAAQDAADKYRIMADERHLTFRIGGSGTVNADKQLMTQAIDDLISNAVKYASDGSTIEVSVSDERLVMKNRYDGKTDKTVDELWQPFVKGDSSRNGQNGSGLGLYIVKNICDRHGFESAIDMEAGIFTATIKWK